MSNVQRVAVPVDRYAGTELPTQVHDWTLFDAGPFRVSSEPRLQVRIVCKCGSPRFIERTAWYRGDVPKTCKRCFCRSRTKVKGYAAPPGPYRPALLPHWGRG